MAYELYALRVPAGADLEETAEALAVRVAAEIERGAERAAPDRERLSAVVTGAEGTLVDAAPEIPGTRAFTDGAGLRVDVHEDFVRVQIGYIAESDVAGVVLDRVWRVLRAVAGATSWPAYDPQGVAALLLDEAGRDETLELYLSVVDQLSPGPRASGRNLPGEHFP